jgi:hypothetical protein
VNVVVAEIGEFGPDVGLGVDVGVYWVSSKDGRSRIAAGIKKGYHCCYCLYFGECDYDNVYENN